MNAADLLTNAGILGVVGIIYQTMVTAWIKASIDNKYNARLETLKTQLQAEADVRLLEETHKLQIAAKEHELRFGVLQEKRALVVAETYSALYDSYCALNEYINSVQAGEDNEVKIRLKPVYEAGLKFEDTFARQRIYFPSAISEALESIRKQMSEIAWKFHFQVEMDQSQPRNRPGIYILTKSDSWLEIITKLEIDIKPALRNLEEEMRKLIGAER